jgi:c-di-GMP-binding flagellar brake protein YcgR
MAMATPGTQAERTFERAPFDGRVCVCRNRQARPALSANIGGGGVLLETEEDLAERTFVTLRIDLPGAEQRAFTVLGRVVRTCREEGVRHARAVAVEFLDIMPRDREALAAYVERVLGYGPSFLAA